MIEFSIKSSENYKIIELPNNQKIEIDLGCGDGTFAIQLAQKYPNHKIIATDILGGRLRKIIKKINKLNIHNLEVLKIETWEFLDNFLLDNVIDRIHLLCPDPWPKQRHKKNRIISSEFLHRVYRKLKQNGIFHFSTDDSNYFNHTKNLLDKLNFFVEDNTGISDIIDIKTDFEIFWNLQNKEVRHLSYKKI